MDATAGTGVLELRERIEATPEVVFDYLVDVEKLLRWMGVDAEIDPRPGGSFKLDINGRDVAVGEYVEVARPNRVVFTWGWVGSEHVPPGSSTVSFDLEADGDATVVLLRHADLPGGQSDPHREGWSYFLPRLIGAAEGRELPPQDMG